MPPVRMSYENKTAFIYYRLSLMYIFYGNDIVALVPVKLFYKLQAHLSHHNCNSYKMAD